jgi:tetratricopeptide (TPR) repeat protein
MSLLLLARIIGTLILMAMSSCQTERSTFQDGMAKMQARNYGEAIEDFDKSLSFNPDGKSALYRKAYCLYKLDKHAEALPLFEDFLKMTDNNEWTATFMDERRDAEFFMYKCKEKLGQPVPQDPSKIPPPPMGE